MTNFKKEYEIKAKDFIRAGEGSIQIQSTLKSIGYDPDIIRRASVCAYEAEMNAVMHGSDGTITLTLSDTGVTIEVKDNGPGIEDVEQALQEGYSTALTEHREMGFGAGMGLPNIKKNADSLEIKSQKGKNTYLKICFQVKKHEE